MKSMSNSVLGIDIGGTNIAVGLVTSSGEILAKSNFKTKSFSSPRKMVETIYDWCQFQESTIIGIGIGAPNGNYFTGSIDFAPNLPWEGKIQLAHLFESKFKLKTLVSNDANAAALGEKQFGAARKFKDFVIITLGTGLGSGIIINNELIIGSNSLAGEYGHISVVPNGRKCGCGRLGCLETYASATGVVRSIEELKSEHKENSNLPLLDQPSAKLVFEFAQNGDEFAQEIIDYTASILGQALANFACFSDPEAFVLFGGIAQSGNYFSEKVKIEMEKSILNIYKDKIQIVTSELHNKNAAILGASALAWSNI